MEDNSFHEPVLLHEVLKYMINGRDEGTVCDCTIGGGGHLHAMLTATRQTRFIGIDWDPDAVAFTKKRLQEFPERVVLVRDNFINLGLILTAHGITELSGVLLDLGVSYHQLQTPRRGFSFDRDGELSMRMSPDSPSLLQMIKQATERQISLVLSQYGDVRNYRRLARVIFQQRHLLKTTYALRDIVATHTPPRFLKKNLHRVFQAFRIWVNDELNNLEKGLSVAFENLRQGGRLVVIAYHSGEDRIVKRMFKSFAAQGIMKVLSKKVIRPTAAEVERNRRARSARLRAGEKCA